MIDTNFLLAWFGFVCLVLLLRMPFVIRGIKTDRLRHLHHH